jgi:hypothetical protein
MQGMKQVFITKLTDVSLTDKEGIGTIRQEGGCWYKYVMIKNHTATVAGAAGTLVGYYATTGFGAHRVVVDLSDADTIPVPAGALCGTVTGTLDVAYYGWVQTCGPVTLDTAVTSAAAGKNFIMSTTDKTGTVATNGVNMNAGVCLNGTTGVVLMCAF